MVKLYYTNSNANVFNILLSELEGKTSSIGEKNLVFCEEKISLMAERLICEKFKGSFNTDVYSFGNFLRKQKTIKGLLSKEGSAMVVKKILKSVPLQCFKKSRGSLAPALYEVIIQLKSANITVDNLKNALDNTQGVLKNKLEDIYNVYFEYEKYLAENSLEDQSSVMNYLPFVIKEYKNISSATVYIIGYESFTVQMKKVISEIIKNAKSVCAILVSGKNEFAFVNETVNAFRKIVLDCGEKIEEKRIDYNYNPENQTLINGLFNPLENYKNQLETDKVFLIDAKSVKEEVERVAEIIKFKVMEKGLRYKDFTLIVPDPLTYREYILDTFNEFDIPVFFDEKKKPDNHPLIRLIISYADAIRNNFEIESLCAFFKNPLVNPDKTFTDRFENFLIKHGVNYGRIQKEFAFNNEDEGTLLEFNKFREKLCSLLSSFNVRKLLKDLDVNNALNGYTEFLLNCGENDFSSVNEQIYSSVIGILDEMDMILGGEKLSPLEFKNIFTSGILALELSVIPQYNDAVFIGGFKEASLGVAKNLFAIGLTSSVPEVRQDVALLSDSDINSLESVKVLIEPKIRVVNKRAKEQAVLGLSSFSDNLYISYPFSDLSGKKNLQGEIVDFIKNRFKYKKCDKRFPFLTFKQGLKRFSYDCGRRLDGKTDDIDSASDFYFADESGKAEKILERAKSQLKERLEKNKEVLILDSTSPTAIEKYQNCPYKYFIMHALGVKERESADSDNAKIGTLLHAVFKEYLSNIDKVKDEGSSDKVFYECIDKLEKSGEIPEFSKEESERAILTSALEECRKFCYRNYLWTKNSEFKVSPKNLEVSIDKVGERLTLLNGKFSIGGKVDRIDETDDYFRIIDYKTGKAEDCDKELFAGVKLQLYLYALSIKEKKVAGAYYLPVSDKYVNPEDKESALVVGKTLNDEDVLIKHDKDFTPEKGSNFIPVKVSKKTGKLNSVLKNDEFNSYLDYAYKVSANAVKQMDEGIVVPSPYLKSCEYCELRALCNRELGNTREIKKVDASVIFKSTLGEENGN